MRDDVQMAMTYVAIVDSKQDAKAFHDVDRRSVRIVSNASSIYVSGDGPDGFIVDPRLAEFDRFVIALPRGAEELRDQLALRLDDARCVWIDWPDGVDSAVDCLEKFGANGLRDALDDAKPMWTDEVCTMAAVPEPGPERTYKTGFDRLDEHGWRLMRPAFMPVIGPYGSGKSVFLRQLACNLWRLHGWRTLVTAFEERIKPRYQRDLRRFLIGRSDNYTTADDIAKADAEIEQAFRFLRRKRNETMCGDRFLDRVEFAARVYGIEVVILDPVNEIDHTVPRGESKTDYMGRLIMRMKQMADAYDLLFIVAAHPPKDGVEKKRAGKILTLNDGADTAHYGNKADIGLTVWRPGLDDGPTIVNIDKLKDHEMMGKPTLARLAFDAGLGKFTVTDVGFHVIGEFLE